MPKAQQMHGAPRQRPVSCRFCRSRKLRCSREAPCSNCVSRGIRCEVEYPVGPSPGTSEPEIVERIRKLEESVENQKPQQNENVKQHSESSDTHAQQAHRSTLSPQIEHLDNDVAWLESIYSGQDLSVNIIYLQQ
jgi:Fungal Zn(2)-Cys(6) binuclear cluster domain